MSHNTSYKTLYNNTNQKFSNSILDIIGNTPLINVEGIWLKLEFINPSGSIKARIAKYIIEQAEENGLLCSGDTIVEASSGNTGNAMSMVAAAKGYKMIVIMPGGLSNERTIISQNFGAEVIKLGDFHVNQALQEAKRLGSKKGYFNPSQFDNEQNVEENRTWLGPEILSQLPAKAKPDAFVMGVGTGGTLIGVGQAMRESNPNFKLYAMEPAESRTLERGEVSKHQIEGISDGFIPGIIQRHKGEIDDFIPIKSADAIKECARLGRKHGLFVGPSTGANVLAAKQIQKSHPEYKNIITIACDEGEKYLSKY